MAYFIQVLLVALLYHLTNTFASFGGMVFGRYTCQRPLVGGLLVGLIFGDLQKGLELGIAFQLAYMGAFAVGGAVSVDVGVVSYPIMAMSIINGLDTGTALAIAAPISILTANLTHVMRAFNTVCTGIVRKGIKEVDYKKIEVGNVILPQVFLAAMNFAVVFVLMYLGTGAVDSLLAVVPQNVLHALGLLGGILPAVGMAMLLKYNIVGNWMFIFFVLGFMMVSSMQMGFIPIAIFAAALAFLYWKIDSRPETAAESASAGVNVFTDDDDVEM
ncbi:PTS sugar transporter subunit IIC [Olsenella massiliensis]|uniref:PTS sugar transporter subunit IIC n=1 Tax=Olsenella massiliensis TaxID=1622075 RepID=UPI00071D446F|nr:PTS sugar transporter subunit IIC [Olsenella massiliensis]